MSLWITHFDKWDESPRSVFGVRVDLSADYEKLFEDLDGTSVQDVHSDFPWTYFEFSYYKDERKFVEKYAAVIDYVQN